ISDVQPIHHNKPLELGDISLEIIHLPGHSPGHCGLYDHESHVLFIADIDLRRFGPWYGWKNSNLQLFQKSVEILTSFIKTHAISLVISSHTKPIDKHECLNRLANFKQVFGVRKKKILEYISKKQDGTSIEEIVNQSFIYPKSNTDQSFVNHVFERHHIEHHIDELIKEKRIYNNGDLLFLA
ncbi:MAG: MBL fold metallo-hydrolase, partial [Promethearchaeota archaeon]